MNFKKREIEFYSLTKVDYKASDSLIKSGEKFAIIIKNPCKRQKFLNNLKVLLGMCNQNQKLKENLLEINEELESLRKKTEILEQQLKQKKMRV